MQWREETASEAFPVNLKGLCRPERGRGRGGARRALRGATESTVHHIHNFSETHNYKPSCQPQGSDRIFAAFQGQV